MQVFVLQVPSNIPLLLWIAWSFQCWKHKLSLHVSQVSGTNQESKDTHKKEIYIYKNNIISINKTIWSAHQILCASPKCMKTFTQADTCTRLFPQKIWAHWWCSFYTMHRSRVRLCPIDSLSCSYCLTILSDIFW